MNHISALLIAMFTFQAFASNDNACIPIKPSQECIDYFWSRTPLNQDEAKKLCRGGVTMDCVNYLWSRTSLDHIGAAKVCKGGVTIECIEETWRTTSKDIIESAKFCGGQED